MPNYLLTFIIVGIPEAIATVMICLALLGERWPFRKIFIVAAIITLVAYTFRLLPLAFGVHAVMYAATLGYLLSRMSSAPAIKACTVAAAAMVFLCISDTASFILFENVLGIKFQELAANVWLWSLSGLPHVLILFLAAFALNRFPLSRLHKTSERTDH